MNLMKSNIIRAIINLVNNPVTLVSPSLKSSNRVNNIGESLEEYVKNVFSNTFSETDYSKKLEKWNQCFSYFGNQNNPPDFMLINGGDAIEVKKLESKKSDLALNSSYPKAKLFSNSPMITESCKTCEKWDVRDIIYISGVVKNKNLLTLTMVYGVDYAATASVYERIRDLVKDGIAATPTIEFAETNELGRVNKVDPLGITYMRIRNMWHIKNPLNVFDYVYTENSSKAFSFMALINNEKYESFELGDRLELEKLSQKCKNLKIDDVKIKNPNNPVQLKEAKLITFSI